VSDPVQQLRHSQGFCWECPDCTEGSGWFPNEHQARRGYGMHRLQNHDEQDILVGLMLPEED
jgi:hypothetical protein